LKTGNIIYFFTFLLLVPELNATVLNVPNGYPNISEAVESASESDTILLSDGYYTGDNNKNINFEGKKIVLMSENGPENCIIDCEFDGRALIFQSGETSSTLIDGITIIYGFSVENGGAIFISDASPSFRKCIIAYSHSTTFGGGVYIEFGAPEFINCTFVGNYAATAGAIYGINSDFKVNSCILSENYTAG
jgi:hypothetical protein